MRLRGHDEEPSDEKLLQAALSKLVRDAQVASFAADDMRVQELYQDLTKLRTETRMAVLRRSQNACT